MFNTDLENEYKLPIDQTGYPVTTSMVPPPPPPTATANTTSNTNGDINQSNRNSQPIDGIQEFPENLYPQYQVMARQQLPPIQQPAAMTDELAGFPMTLPQYSMKPLYNSGTQQSTNSLPQNLEDSQPLEYSISDAAVQSYRHHSDPTNQINTEQGYFEKAHPMFFSDKISLSYVDELHVPKSILSYTFYSDIFMKLNYHALNTMPFRLCRDGCTRALFVEMARISPIFNFLHHAFLAVAAIDLYFQQVTYQTDDVLNLNKNVYLMLGDYHLAKSMSELTREMSTEEDTKKSVASIMATALCMFYITGCPHRRIADKSYFELGKNEGFFFARYASAHQSSDIFNANCARFVINDYSSKPETFFPNFLFGLATAYYPENNTSGKLHVPILDQPTVVMLQQLVERVNREYRSYVNYIPFENPVGSARQNTLECYTKDAMRDYYASTRTGERPLETEMYGTLTRYIIEIPQKFIDMIAECDPRALIILAYMILILAARGYPYWPLSVYQNELIDIDRKLDRWENAPYWKAWLLTANTALSINS